MKRTTTATYDSLIKLLEERQPDIDAHAVAIEEIEEHKDTLKYYVTTLGEPSLRDIMGGALVKTPAKYFTNLNKAIIYQNKIIMDAHYADKKPDWLINFTIEELNDIQNELENLSETYPEYRL